MPIHLLGMARTLFFVLLTLLLSATLVAQQRQVRIVLQSGKVLLGEFKDADDQTVLLIVPEGELRVMRADIREIVKVVPVPVVQPKPSQPPVAGSEPEVGQPGWNLKKILGADEPVESEQPSPAPGGGVFPVAPETSSQPANTAAPTTPSPDADARVGRLLDRYLWIVPQSQGNKISLGAAIFLILVFFIQLSSRMANLESRSLSRSGLLAAMLFVVLAIQLGITPAQLPFIIGVGVVDLLFWYLLSSLVFSAGVYGSTIMLVSFALSSLVGVLCLEVMGFVLQEGTLT